MAVGDPGYGTQALNNFYAEQCVSNEFNTAHTSASSACSKLTVDRKSWLSVKALFNSSSKDAPPCLLPLLCEVLLPFPGNSYFVGKPNRCSSVLRLFKSCNSHPTTNPFIPVRTSEKRGPFCSQSAL